LDGAIAGCVEDGVVDQDAVYAVVGVGIANGFFELFTFDLAEGECKAAWVCVSYEPLISPHMVSLGR
jgi:hypothetical protein